MITRVSVEKQMLTWKSGGHIFLQMTKITNTISTNNNVFLITSVIISDGGSGSLVLCLTALICE